MSVTLLITILSVLGSSPILVLVVKHILEKQKNKKFNKDRKVTCIRDHHFFEDMNYMSNVMIPRINIRNCPEKSNILRDFLKIKFFIINKHILELTDKIAIGTIPNGSIYTSTIINFITEYEKEALEKGIPEVFVKKFSDWHLPKIHILKDLSINISQNGTYSTKEEVHSAFLDIMIVILHLTILDAGIVMSKMNGELDAVLGINKEHNYE